MSCCDECANNRKEVLKKMFGPGFIPGIVVGLGGLWAFHKFVKAVPGKGS